MAFKPVSPPVTNAVLGLAQAWIKINKHIAAIASAAGTDVDATAFIGNLSGSDTTVQAALETIDGLEMALTGVAADTEVDASGFGNNLSAVADTNVQTALETIDALDLSGWVDLIPVADFVTTAASATTVTMVSDQSARIQPGYVVEFTNATGTRSAIVASCTANLLTIHSGCPINEAVLTGLAYRQGGGTVTTRHFLPGAITSTVTAIQTNALTAEVWQEGPARLARLGSTAAPSGEVGVPPSLAHTNLYIDAGSGVSSDHTNDGPKAGRLPDYNYAATLIPENCLIYNGSWFEIETTTDTDPTQNATVVCVWALARHTG